MLYKMLNDPFSKKILYQTEVKPIFSLVCGLCRTAVDWGETNGIKQEQNKVDYLQLHKQISVWNKIVPETLIEIVNQTKLLCSLFSSDLTWWANTYLITGKAFPEARGTDKAIWVQCVPERPAPHIHTLCGIHPIIELLCVAFFHNRSWSWGYRKSSKDRSNYA